MTVWSDIDEPVLRWLLDQPPCAVRPWILQLDLRPPQPAEELQGRIDSDAFDAALQRLLDHGLIDGTRGETIGHATWSRLRVTAQGLQVLGEWPDLDLASSRDGLGAVLDLLAESADDPDDRAALRGAVGIVGSIGEGVVLKTLDAAGDELGRDLG